MAKHDIYSKLTDQIVAALQQGVQPWFKPWNSRWGDKPVSRPLRHNGQPYSGINVIMLWLTAEGAGYGNPYWMTFRQAKELGGHVRKDEIGTEVIFSSRVSKKNADGEDETYPLMRTYHVFNCDQIDNLPEQYRDIKGTLSPDQRISDAETFFANLNMTLRHRGGRAFYNPANDYVQLPPFENFLTPADYYCTLGHESVHWTGHTKRLNREFGQKRFGDEGYAMEELVAEIASAYLAADLGIAAIPREDHAGYLAAWLKVLQNDTKAIFTAASFAEKAVAYLHAQQPAASYAQQSAA